MYKEGDTFIEKISYTDYDLTNPSGQVGIGTWNATASFSDIMVNGFTGDADVYRQTNEEGGRAFIEGLSAKYTQVRTSISITHLGQNAKAGFIMGDYGIYLDGENIFVTDEKSDSEIIGTAKQDISENTMYSLSAEYIIGNLIIKVNNMQALSVAVSNTDKLMGAFAFDLTNSTAEYGSLYIKRFMPSTVGTDTNPRFQLSIPKGLPEPEPVELNSPYQNEP